MNYSTKKMSEQLVAWSQETGHELWMPGMRALRFLSKRVQALRCTADDEADLGEQGWVPEPGQGWLPDLDDPGTLGCLERGVLRRLGGWLARSSEGPVLHKGVEEETVQLRGIYTQALVQALLSYPRSEANPTKTLMT